MGEVFNINEEAANLFIEQMEKGHDSGWLYLVVGIILAITPYAARIGLIFIKKWIEGQKDDIKTEITDTIKEDTDDFKEVIRDQMNAVKETVEVVKTHSKISQKHHEENQNIMMLHIEELKHLHNKVNGHDEKLAEHEKKIQKNQNEIGKLKT